MKIKINIKLVIVSTICLVLLSSCGSSEHSRYESAYIEAAKKVLADFGLTGDAKMEYDSEYEGYKVFNLIVESDDYELLPQGQQIAFLSELDEIWVADADLLVLDYVISQGNKYNYYDSDNSFYKNGEQINSPSPSTSSSSSSSSSSTCDTLWSNLDAALLLSGGETTDLTVYYTQALMDNDCFD